MFARSQSWEADILKQWADPKRLFPAIPPADFAYARARLTAFRSNIEWVTVFEIIGYDSEAGEVINQVHVFGNKVDRQRHLFSFDVVAPTSDVDIFPWFNEDQDGSILVDPLNFTVDIRGVIQHFSPTAQEYADLGIDFAQKTAGQIDSLVKVVRLLAYTIPEQLFYSDEELLRELGRPVDLVRFLQTYEWRHPDWRRHEKPHDSLCLVNLARALAYDNAALYLCPPEQANTHWSHWPEWPS